MDHHSGIETAPSPTDPESFRQALSVLLAEAAANGVDVGDRPWECVSTRTDTKWDVEIVTLDPYE